MAAAAATVNMVPVMSERHVHATSSSSPAAGAARHLDSGNAA